MSTTFITVAVLHTSGQVSRVQIIARCALGQLAPELAFLNGYRREGDEWVLVENLSNIGRIVRAQQFPKHVNIGGQLGEEATFIETGPIVSWRIVQPEDFPDATYKNAWTDDGQKITHNMGQAREIFRQRLRRLREAKFKVLDSLRAPAVRQNNTARIAELDAEAEKWADAPADPRIEAAQSVEELKQIKLSA